MADDTGPDDIVAEVVARIDWPDRAVAQAATSRWRSLTKPEGALGRLEDLGTWWASVSARRRRPSDPC